MKIIHFLDQTADKTHIIAVIENSYYLVVSSSLQQFDQEVNDFINYLKGLINYYNIKTKFHQNLTTRTAFSPINLTLELEEEIAALLAKDPNFSPYLTLALIPPEVAKIIEKIINSPFL